MEKATAKALQRRIAQHPTIQQTQLFYTENKHRVFTWDDAYDPSIDAQFGIEITVQSQGLHPDLLTVLGEVGVTVEGSLTETNRFRVTSTTTRP